MTRKVLILVLALSTMAFLAAGVTASQARPGEPCPPPNGGPVCVDGIHIPPGLAKACDKPIVAQHNKNCQKINPPPEVCGTDAGETPADGPVSGIVEQIAAGVRDGGGAPLADLLDAVACQLLAPLGL